MEALTTRYKNYRFRSRTEARWAVFFDALGLWWEYEEQGFALSTGEWYLPDFRLPKKNLWVEIKGGSPTPEEDQKARSLALDSDMKVLLLAGSPQNPKYRHPDAPKHLLYDPNGDVSPAVLHVLFGVPVRSPKLLAAYGEAMEARFEHGERGGRARILNR